MATVVTHVSLSITLCVLPVISVYCDYQRWH